MKKIFALILTLAMVLSLTACGGGNSGSGGSGDGGATPPAGGSGDSKTYKVAMICDSSISDGGWGMACYNAMVDAAAKYGWDTEVSDSIAQSAYYESIVAFCDLGYDLIYAPGNQYTDAILQAAEEYPNIAFALLNGGADTPAKADRQGGLHRRHGDRHHQGQVRWLRGVRRVRGPAGGQDRGGPGRGLLRRFQRLRQGH